MMTPLVLALLVCACSADPLEQFAQFKAKHGKVYTSAKEEGTRFAIFKDNLRKIEEHNQAGHSWQLGVTQFADLTKEEFVKTYANGRLPPRSVSSSARNYATAPRKDIKIEDLPASVDWREQGAITDVRNQGQCGSCWAFASAAAMSAYGKINDMSHDLVTLSTQHITSCTPNPLHCGGTGGCMGSIEPLAFTYASMFGIVTEEEYPYTSGDPTSNDDQVCDFDATTTDVSLITMGFETLPHNDALAVMDHLANKGPLAASVAASDWGFYSGGVFDGCDYDSNIAVNHAVLLMGYGTDEDGQDYWLIQNSWGEHWGDVSGGNPGFIKLRRQETTQCGEDTTPLDGSGCEDGGVESVHVCGTCAVVSDNSYPIGATYVK